MPKFYDMKEEEIKEYKSIRFHSQKELEGLVNWIEFRKKHPFISWLLMTLTGTIPPPK